MQISRKDIGYTVYSRFEEALRGFVGENIDTHGAQWLNYMPAGIIDKVRERKSLQVIPPDLDIGDFLDETDLPDLSEIICFNNGFDKFIRHGDMAQQQFQDLISTMYRLRNKIAHVKNSFSAVDLDILMETSGQFVQILQHHGEDLRYILECINTNPAEVVVKLPDTFLLDDVSAPACLNNLPAADYDPDGGFIGRKDDIKKIRQLIQSDLDRVITIVGAGGVGKSALAHKYCKSLLERTPTQFDAVVWISAKEEKLTLTGIEPIQPIDFIGNSV